MKKKLLLTLSLLLPALVSCKNGGNEPTTPVGPDDPPVGPVVPDDTKWSDEEVTIFNEHLYGYLLPYIDGATVNYDEETKSVILNGGDVDLDGLNNYASLLENEGFAKEKGPYSNTYSLYKTVNFENKERTIEIDLFAAAYNGVICLDGVGILTGVCYDPYIYEWPTNEIDDYLDSLYKKPSLKIPSYNCNRYSLDTSNLDRGKLGIYCDALSNTAETIYTESLKKNGFNIGKERNNKGYLVAEDPEQTIRVLYQYSSTTNVLGIMLEMGSGWPFALIDDYVSQLTLNSGTELPPLYGADKYEVVESAYDYYGYVFIRCVTQVDPTKEYEKSLEAYGYTLYNESLNTAGNYATVSRNRDLLVQYEYTDYGDEYNEFCILFEPFYEYGADKVARALDLVVPGTKTVLPEYPGQGFKVSLSDNYQIATFKVQSSSYEALEDYVATLVTNKWSVAADQTKFWTYTGYSPTRDFKLDITLNNGYVTITLKANNDPYKGWPTNEINEIVTSLGAKGLVPEMENCLGFDVENNQYWHDVVCFVSFGSESSVIDSYINKISSLGYQQVNINGLTYYQKQGDTIAIRPYFEKMGIILIDLVCFDNYVYDVDFRDKFNSWKENIMSRDTVSIPGFNLSVDVVNVTLVTESNTLYENCDLFQLKIQTGTTNLNSSIEEIENQFKEFGWQFNSTENVYKNSSFSLKVYSNDKFIYVDIYSPIKDVSVLGLTQSFIADLGLTNTISIPSTISLSKTYSIEVLSYSPKDIDLYLYLNFTSKDNASTGYNELVSLFKSANWREDYKGTSYIYLVDPTSTLELYLGKSGTVVDYNIYKHISY